MKVRSLTALHPTWSEKKPLLLLLADMIPGGLKSGHGELNVPSCVMDDQTPSIKQEFLGWGPDERNDGQGLDPTL